MAELENMSSNEKHLLTGNLYVIHEKDSFSQPLSMGCCRESGYWTGELETLASASSPST